ncbi:MAG: MFS transporter [Tetragenococcus koreensis]|nr:MFS transporter [Tetragenococcus koreensis]
MAYASYFFIQAGMSEDMSFKLTIIMFVIGIVRTLVSWMITSHCGRSNIYFYGLCCMSVLLLLIGGLGCSSQKNASWGVGGLLIVFAFAYNSSLGPLVYCIVTELPSSRLRAKTVIIARNLYNIAGIVVQVITPYMLNPTAWNRKAKSGFLWAGVCIIGSVWAFFDLPETKGRTFAELDILFEKKKPSRHFLITEVDVFDAGKLMENIGEEGIRNFVVKNETPETV